MAFIWIAEWETVLKQLDRIEVRLRTLNRQGQYTMASIQDVIAEVRRTTTVVAGIKAAVDGLKAKIVELEAALAAAIANSVDQATIDGLQSELDAANDALELVTAVTENTPSA